jgi:mono/diheme cytochrome c family protein
LAASLVVLGACTTLAAACSGSDQKSEPQTGAQIFQAICATCHAKDGSGFVGPSLYDVAQRYPDVADQIAVVTNGKGQMPSFADRLSPRQIRRVVEYTRRTFVTNPSPSTTVFEGPTLPPTTRP